MIDLTERQRKVDETIILLNMLLEGKGGSVNSVDREGKDCMYCIVSRGSIGGNTGTVNSFTGVDLGDTTGGVYNAQTLFEGNNLG